MMPAFYDVMVIAKLSTETYDDTIQKMIAKIKKPRQSYFGKFKGLGEFKRTDQIDRFS